MIREPATTSTANDAAIASAPTASRMLGGFVFGPENMLVSAAVFGLLSNPSSLAGSASLSADASLSSEPFATSQHGPLLLVGSSGAGKTTLLQEIAKAWQQAGGPRPVVYIAGKEFSQQLGRATHADRVDEFHAKIDRAELFLFDGLEALVRAKSAMTALRFQIDRLAERGVPIVITSAKPLYEMPSLPPGLVARLVGGTFAELALPGVEARKQIVARMAIERGVRLDVAAIDQLALRITQGPTAIAAALLKLNERLRSETRASEPSRTRLATSDAIDDVVASSGRRRTPIFIGQITARHFGLTMKDLQGSSRARPIVLARGIAMYLSRELNGDSLLAIGRAFGNRDHTTVLHQCRKLSRLMKVDAPMRQTLQQLSSAIESNIVA